MKQLPTHSVELIEHLNSLYPLTTPKLGTPEHEIWYKFGQRSVVEYLRAIIRHQQEDINILDASLLTS